MRGGAFLLPGTVGRRQDLGLSGICVCVSCPYEILKFYVLGLPWFCTAPLILE